MIRKLTVLITSLLIALKMRESLLKINIGSFILFFCFLSTEMEVCPLVCLFPGSIPSMKILSELRLTDWSPDMPLEAEIAHWKGCLLCTGGGEEEWALPYPLAPN